MTDTTTPCRGAAPVGRLADLPPHEAAAVVAMREWTGTPPAEPAEVARGAYYMGQILDALQHFGRRPLMRHHVGCRCLGADEACLAQLIGSAAEGAREDAMMIACLLVRADAAPILADIAQMAALHLQREGRAPRGQDRPDPTCPARPVLH